MPNSATVVFAALLFVSGVSAAADAGGWCATAEQARRVQDFYAESPGALPVVAARRLELPEATVASGITEQWVASADRTAFADVWAAMATWEQANFLIIKGQNVFEILSGVSPGAPSETSQFFNLKYEHPLRGHLRPDLFGAIFVVALPGKGEAVARGTLFYDEAGALVFGAFMSGESLRPSASEIRKFDELMAQVRSLPAACVGSTR